MSVQCQRWKSEFHFIIFQIVTDEVMAIYVTFYATT